MSKSLINVIALVTWIALITRNSEALTIENCRSHCSPYDPNNPDHSNNLKVHEVVAHAEKFLQRLLESTFEIVVSNVTDFLWLLVLFVVTVVWLSSRDWLSVTACPLRCDCPQCDCPLMTGCLWLIVLFVVTVPSVTVLSVLPSVTNARGKSFCSVYLRVCSR